MSPEEVEIVARAIVESFSQKPGRWDEIPEMKYRAPWLEAAHAAIASLDQHRARRPYTRADYDAAPEDGTRYR